MKLTNSWKALAPAPLLALGVVLFGVVALLGLSHSGLSSFGLAPPASSLGAARDSRDPASAGGPLVPDAGGSAPRAHGYPVARPPVLLTLRNILTVPRAVPEDGRDVRRLADASALPAPAASTLAPVQPSLWQPPPRRRPAESRSTDTGDLVEAVLPLDDLFLPGEPVFSDAGTARLRLRMRELLAQSGDGDEAAASYLRMGVLFGDDLGRPAPGQARRYQERTVMMLRLLGVLTSDAVVDYVDVGGRTLPVSGDDAESQSWLVLALRAAPDRHADAERAGGRSADRE